LARHPSSSWQRSFREAQDPVADFIAECCVVGDGTSATVEELYTVYSAWAKAAGERQPLTKKGFAHHLSGTASQPRGREGREDPQRHRPPETAAARDEGRRERGWDFRKPVGPAQAFAAARKFTPRNPAHAEEHGELAA